MQNRKGYFGIGVYHPKTEENIGTLWRHAMLYDAAFIFTIGRRYTKQGSDTSKSDRHIPLYHYIDIAEFSEHRPLDCPVVCIELAPYAEFLRPFNHPERCIYLLGAENHGIPFDVMQSMQAVVQIEAPNEQSMNVATSGTIVMRDRYIKSVGPQREVQ